MASAQINNIRVDHNMVQNGMRGMFVFVSFDVQNLMNRPGQVSVYFNYWQGAPLRDFDQKYKTEDGHVGVSEDFTPLFDTASYPYFGVFVPYEALEMAPGEVALMCQVIIWDISLPVSERLATSQWIQFYYRQFP